MQQYSRVGVDLAQNVFHVHALECADERAVTRKLSRAGMRNFFASITPSLAGMECAVVL